MFNVDLKDIKKLTDNLKKISRSAYPLAVRGTLNRLAFETSNIAKKEILPKLFTLRNKYIQGTVGYQRCQNTFNIAAMESFAGQFDTSKGKPTGQLAKQETGSPIVAKGKYTFAATPSARGGSYKKTVRKANLFASLKVYKLPDLVQNPTSDRHKEVPQAIAFAEKYNKTFGIIGYSPVYLRYSIFGIRPTGKAGRASMLYTLEDKKTYIKKRPWLYLSTRRAQANAHEIYQDEAINRIEKILSKGLSK